MVTVALTVFLCGLALALDVILLGLAAILLWLAYLAVTGWAQSPVRAAAMPRPARERAKGS